MKERVTELVTILILERKKRKREIYTCIYIGHNDVEVEACFRVPGAI